MCGMNALREQFHPSPIFKNSFKFSVGDHLKSSLPTLWTRSYFVSTHGHVSSETIKKYIEEQSKE